ncbi:MAG: sn-glycerol-3-phosphate ABC transporter ATP-binding protein UgpC [Propionivibrio sp.]|jgi:multiple sugar transport system ATP-binding protein|uniref:ABC transporter ATP-binding protein n=1 Tax=Propionivibrio sp. TaxID=2212460 RepID=UPI001B5FB02E|nr:sn-glycerol-3-phosphate ABC transporter ATP-binding protein UgpC [Propionivibrio sp.]MBP7201671.1 sn-glycerol-3-phosphate ABC transporter ATP-binding protein UgpC [Propionivibrio sp.]
MASVELIRIRKSYDTAAEVIKGVDLSVKDGEFMVFVGPSGCGKSTLLRMIAGLEDISGGELQIEKRRCNFLPASKRGVAMVFQNYALYPHMTVFDNMAFALKLAGVNKNEVKTRVHKAAAILRLEALLERKPAAMSGGQRQRVAIGRAIVRNPGVFLFDEPLSNLDAALRVQMRIEIARLHKELGTTMVYVTHDQMEAMTLGDRIAVFNEGRIEQVGAPLELYEQPANLFVAGFIGSPKMNLIEALAVDGEIRFGTGSKVALPVGLPLAAGKCHLGIRPEHLVIGDASTPGIDAMLVFVEQLGDATLLYVQVDGIEETLTARQQGIVRNLETGERVRLSVLPEYLHLFDASGKRVGRARL